MGSTNSIIPWLFGFTLLAVVAILLWYRKRAQTSRDIRGEHGHVSHPPPDRHTPNNHTP